MPDGDESPRQSEIDAAPSEPQSGLVYHRSPHSSQATDLLIAYRWPLFISALLGFIALLLTWAFLDVGPATVIGAIPSEMWSFVWYMAIGAFPAGVAAFWLVLRFESIDGVEVLDLDPITGHHRHVRVGNSLWADLDVRSPWGTSVGQDDLQPCTVNGHHGYEVMDFRITSDGTPTCVATWLGESSGAAFRTYKNAYRYAHKRLSRRANRATMLRANQGEIAREAAERVVYLLVKSSEQSGMPHGEEIDAVVQDVLDDHGLGDPLDDDLDDGIDLGSQVSEPEESRNGQHDESDADAALAELLGGQA